MEYRIIFKRLEEGDDPEENYETLGKGLQYQGVKEAPVDVIVSMRMLLVKLTSGREQRMVVPEGKTLEVIFKD